MAVCSAKTVLGNWDCSTSVIVIPCLKGVPNGEMARQYVALEAGCGDERLRLYLLHTIAQIFMVGIGSRR